MMFLPINLLSTILEWNPSPPPPPIERRWPFAGASLRTAEWYLVVLVDLFLYYLDLLESLQSLSPRVGTEILDHMARFWF